MRTTAEADGVVVMKAMTTEVTEVTMTMMIEEAEGARTPQRAAVNVIVVQDHQAVIMIAEAEIVVVVVIEMIAVVDLDLVMFWILLILWYRCQLQTEVGRPRSRLPCWFNRLSFIQTGQCYRNCRIVRRSW